MMRPFFSFYGGKWRSAKYYPKPEHSRIVEPFAGSAGYSLRYPEREIILIEKDPLIAGLWKYLILATAEEILSLPLFPQGGHISDLDCSEPAKTLIGFWLNKGTISPKKTESLWMRTERYAPQFWGAAVRERIANQVMRIKHWTIIEGDYSQGYFDDATYFIDPPYEKAGRHYVHSSRNIDFKALGWWCENLPGQVIVCENVGATWLPFQPFKMVAANKGSRGGQISAEALWQNL